MLCAIFKQLRVFVLISTRIKTLRAQRPVGKLRKTLKHLPKYAVPYEVF